MAVTQLPFYKIRFADVRYVTNFKAINWNLISFTNTLNRKYDCSGGLASSISTTTHDENRRMQTLYALIPLNMETGHSN